MIQRVITWLATYSYWPNSEPRKPITLRRSIRIVVTFLFAFAAFDWLHLLLFVIGGYAAVRWWLTALPQVKAFGRADLRTLAAIVAWLVLIERGEVRFKGRYQKTRFSASDK